MADAERDQNRVTTLLAVSSTDGVTPLKAEITAATGRLRTDNVITSSIPSGTNTIGKVYITDGTDDVLVTSEKSLYTIDHGLEIARGTFSTMSLIHKFGAAPDFDTDDNEVTIWDGANDGGIDEMSYTYSATAAIDTISSSNNGDTQDIEIQGLDSNYDLVTQTVTLTGQTQATLGTSLIRVFRAKNVGSTNLAGDVYIFEQTADAGGDGIPDDTTKIRAVIYAANNQTEMAIYTVPDGKSAYMRGFYATNAGARQTADYLIKLKVRPFGQVFQLKHKMVIPDTTAPFQHIYTDPQKFTEKSDIEMTVQVLTAGKTDANMIAGFDVVLVDD
jgi:hypothetical protein